MSTNTKIEWTQGDDGTPGATWNPVTGCTKVSPGCDHCYAETFAERWRGTPGHHFEQGFDVTLRPERLEQPLHWKRPRRIFTNSMSDLFHEAVPDAFIAEMFAVMASAQRHTFQVLTKRHGRMRSLLSSPAFPEAITQAAARLLRTGQPDFRALETWPLPNVWLGVSVEDQKWADIRIPALIETPAAVRFLSCEPLLGPVGIDHYLWLTGPSTAGPFYDYAGRRRGGGGIGGSAVTSVRARDLHWVIVGGESGPGARPMHPAWARLLRDQCADAEVPFFFKQWGAHRWVEHSRYDDATQCWVADGIEPQRVSKKLAGRELDGQEWNQFPRTAETAVA